MWALLRSRRPSLKGRLQIIEQVEGSAASTLQLYGKKAVFKSGEPRSGQLKGTVEVTAQRVREKKRPKSSRRVSTAGKRASSHLVFKIRYIPAAGSAGKANSRTYSCEQGGSASGSGVTFRHMDH